jgi:hypothetical protein
MCQSKKSQAPSFPALESLASFGRSTTPNLAPAPWCLRATAPLIFWAPKKGEENWDGPFLMAQSSHKNIIN